MPAATRGERRTSAIGSRLAAGIVPADDERMIAGYTGQTLVFDRGQGTAARQGLAIARRA